MDECRCLIPDENDNCIDCGKHIDLLDFDGPMPDLGDIVGICKLIDETATLAIGRCLSNPASGSLEILKPAYEKAKALGYRGTYERWEEFVSARVSDILDS